MGPNVRGWQGQSLTHCPSASPQHTISQAWERDGGRSGERSITSEEKGVKKWSRERGRKDGRQEEVIRGEEERGNC